MIYKVTYQEQMYTRLMNFGDNDCWQYYYGLILLQ